MLIYLFVAFFIVLLVAQFLLGSGLEGFDNAEGDRLSKIVNDLRGQVFDLNLTVQQLEKNVATLMQQQSSFATNLKSTAPTFDPSKL